MDYRAAIQRVYQHLEEGHVDRAAMVCLRIARNLRDYLNAAVFCREIAPDNKAVIRNLFEDAKELSDEAKKHLYELSGERWLETHTLDFALGKDEHGDPLKVLNVGVGEIEREVHQDEGCIRDMSVPTGMTPYDTAAFTSEYATHKAKIRLRISANNAVKERVKLRCLNYAIGVERQLEAQAKSQSFFEHACNEVNNYFKANSEDVHRKLEKAGLLFDAEDAETLALLLTEVRRAIKAAADFFYPPVKGKALCSDGKERELGEEQYVNRLHEFLVTRFRKSTATELLTAELRLLAVFVRRLNDLASKGVHDEVSSQEAKQGLLGLYMFLYNVTSRLQRGD